MVPDWLSLDQRSLFYMKTTSRRWANGGKSQKCQVHLEFAKSKLMICCSVFFMGIVIAPCRACIDGIFSGTISTDWCGWPEVLQGRKMLGSDYLARAPVVRFSVPPVVWSFSWTQLTTAIRFHSEIFWNTIQTYSNYSPNFTNPVLTLKKGCVCAYVLLTMPRCPEHFSLQKVRLRKWDFRGADFFRVKNTCCVMLWACLGGTLAWSTARWFFGLSSATMEQKASFSLQKHDLQKDLLQWCFRVRRHTGRWNGCQHVRDAHCFVVLKDVSI